MTNIVDETNRDIESLDIDNLPEGEEIDLDLPGLGDEKMSKRALKDGLGISDEELSGIGLPPGNAGKSAIENREFAAEISRIRATEAPYVSKEELNEMIAQAYINDGREVPARYLKTSDTPSL